MTSATPTARTARETRQRAWVTRRQKYGPQGHGTRCCGQRCEKMLALIIGLHVDEALSEGQVAKATGLDRITVRDLRIAEEDRRAGFKK